MTASPDVARIAADYQGGSSMRDIAARHHVGARTVAQILTDAGVPIRTVGAQKAPVSDDDLLRWRHQGYSLRAIAEMAEMSYTGVRRRIAIATTGQEPWR